ncbi:Coiled-coil domain-containing protein 97 [Physocladia obscura]|uniref:Coiled-coil domain-containing protein 97 n=1 Tax=Physocladia obscura TaxID=109957 RepID=A0AAD5T4F4_9FUNG|nr:Coiled-coil domain-containing protein 97 [Physocladia obscura]
MAKDEQTKRNRRFVYLGQLHSDPAAVSTADPAFYFSDHAMRTRDPSLFDYFVARHIPLNERNKPFEPAVGLVDRIYHSIDEQTFFDALPLSSAGYTGSSNDPTYNNNCLQSHRDNELLLAFDAEEFESDDEQGRMDYQLRIQRRVIQRALTRSISNPQPPPPDLTLTARSSNMPRAEDSLEQSGSDEYVSEADRKQLRAELVKIMKERFLDGKDVEYFDYSFVDDNPDYDDLAVVSQEAEERYFDESGSVENADGVQKLVPRSKSEWQVLWETQGSVNNNEYDY